MIQNGDRTKFDVEVLKQLVKLLPESHEVCTLSILRPYLETCLHLFLQTCLNHCLDLSRRLQI